MVFSNLRSRLLVRG